MGWKIYTRLELHFFTVFKVKTKNRSYLNVHKCVGVSEKITLLFKGKYYHSKDEATNLKIKYKRPRLSEQRREVLTRTRRKRRRVSELGLISKAHESGRKTDFTSVNLRRRYSPRSRAISVFAHFLRTRSVDVGYTSSFRSFLRSDIRSFVFNPPPVK